MIRARTSLWTLTALLGLGLFLVACGDEAVQDEASVESIQDALELSDTGGFEMVDEPPAFGLLDLDELELAPNLELPPLPEELETKAGVMPPDPNMPPPPPPPCPHGMLGGHWKPLAQGLGLFHGKWAGAGGKVVGHLKGIYGVNKAGDHVLFGKYISISGKFMGLIKGRFGKGFFKGRWFDKSGLKGGLMGAYGDAKCVKTPTGDTKCLPGAGNFVGKWIADCPACQLSCAPGHLQPPGQCICVPAQVIPCIKGQCPAGMFCDPCPPLPGCDPAMGCPAVCAPPICVPQPPKPPAPPSAPPSGSPNGGEAPAPNVQ